jgi:RNA polymerase sigma-70 factor (ECF subfamily)
MAVQSAPSYPPFPDDLQLAARIGQHDQAAFEALMRRHNGKLFRVARAILKEDADAEDALQDAYLDAYRHIGQFRGGAQLSTWLTRIVINHSLMRLRKQRQDPVVVPIGGAHLDPAAAPEEDPADDKTETAPAALMRSEIRRVLERRIDELPVTFRTVFVLREVEEMSVSETAECLGIPEATVRTRLFRARALLREALQRDINTATIDVFGFAGERCNRIVARVLAILAAEPTALPGA